MNLLHQKPEKLLIRHFITRDAPVFVAQTRLADEKPTNIHVHDFYEFFLVTQGEMLHFLNGNEMHLKERTACLIRPQDIHFFQKYPNSSNSLFINAAFSEKLFKKASRALTISDVALKKEKFLLLQNIPSDEWVILQKGIKQISDLKNAADKCRVLHFLLSLLLTEMFLEKNTPLQYRPEWLENTLLEMRKKENYKEGLQRMVHICGKTQEHLTRTMAELLHLTPTEYINRLRLEEAAQMLVGTGLSITEILFDIGFNNISHFNRLFKAMYGATPRDYRKSKRRIFGS